MLVKGNVIYCIQTAPWGMGKYILSNKVRLNYIWVRKNKHAFTSNDYSIDVHEKINKRLLKIQDDHLEINIRLTWGSVFMYVISSQDFPAGGQIKSCKSTRRLSFWVINLGRFNMFNTCAILKKNSMWILKKLPF